MTGMGVVIFHRVCGSPGTSRPRNHALFFPSISPPSSLLPLFFFSSFVSFPSSFFVSVLLYRDFVFLFFFLFGNFVARWLLVITGGLPELKGGYWLWICIILLKRYIYMGISGKERFLLNDCCHNSFNFTKNLSLYIYIYRLLYVFG